MDKQEKIIDGDFLRKKLTDDIPWVTILDEIVEFWNKNGYLIRIDEFDINKITEDCVNYLSEFYPGIDPNAVKIAGVICYFMSISLPLRVQRIPDQIQERHDIDIILNINCKIAIWLAVHICQHEKNDLMLHDAHYKDLLARLIHKKSECQGIINMLAGYF